MGTHVAAFTPPIPPNFGDNEVKLNLKLPPAVKKNLSASQPAAGSLFQERDPSHLPAKDVVAGSKFSVASFATPSSHTARQEAPISGGLVTKEKSDHTPSKDVIKTPAIKLPSFAAPLDLKRTRRQNFIGSLSNDTPQTPTIGDALRSIGLGDLQLEKEIPQNSKQLRPLGSKNALNSLGVGRSRSNDNSSERLDSPTSSTSTEITEPPTLPGSPVPPSSARVSLPPLQKER